MKIKVSDYVANFFRIKGVQQCFAVTGGGAMHLNDSFGHNDYFDIVYNHHEQACSMAAEGYAQVTGRPAIVSVTSGPGTTNAMTGVLGAWLDSIPMVIISGQMKRETLISSNSLRLRQLGFQEFNIIDSVKAMTKYAVVVDDPRYVHYHLEKAFYEATSGRKGPVWLDIPIDIQGLYIDEDDIIVTDSVQNISSINEVDIKHFFTKLNSAKKPVLLAGYQIRMEDSVDHFQKLINFLGIPVLTEWNNHDLLEEGHLLNAGRPGTIGDRNGNLVLQNSDLLIVLGCQLSLRQISYEWKNFARNSYIIGINSEIEELIKPTLNVDQFIVGSVKEVINSILNSGKKSIHSDSLGWNLWAQKMKQKYPVFDTKKNRETGLLSVYEFFHELSKSILGDSVTVLANGAACVAGLQSIKIGKNQRLFTNAGASSMGYAISASIGAAKAVKNQRRVYCIEGDGSIQMNLQELQTIVHNSLNIKIFWINNDGYHSIRQTQKGMFKAEERGYCGADQRSGISFPHADRIAVAYGIPYFRIDSNSDIENVLKKINNIYGPLICEVITDPNEDFSPKLTSKMNEDGTFTTPSLEDMYPFLSEVEIRENLLELKEFISK
jgi:acetolactate synthase-1/2/3 large subunit